MLNKGNMNTENKINRKSDHWTCKIFYKFIDNYTNKDTCDLCQKQKQKIMKTTLIQGNEEFILFSKDCHYNCRKKLIETMRTEKTLLKYKSTNGKIVDLFKNFEKRSKQLTSYYFKIFEHKDYTLTVTTEYNENKMFVYFLMQQLILMEIIN